MECDADIIVMGDKERVMQICDNLLTNVKMIEYAGLTDLFEGKVDSLPEITFLGIPSMAVERLVYDYEGDSVSDLSRNKCRGIFLPPVSRCKC